MNEVLARISKEIVFGEMQTYRNLAVFPILADVDAEPVYMTLAAALKEQVLLVSEASESGSVPEILVTNKADMPVLILDGEELKGAKQNRASNTTVLVPAQGQIKLNVSCTERCRWHYDSERFSDSGVIMAQRVRRAKSASVSEGFRECREARSDQGEVWEEIEGLHAAMQTTSPTRAMRDAFESHRPALDACLEAFAVVEGQCGFVFAADGRVMGMDFLSRRPAYQEVHSRLLGSYVMELLTGPGTEVSAPDEKRARQFIEQAFSGEVEAYPSTGLGEDVRIRGNGACGSALVHEQTCIHAALFALDTSRRADDEGPRMRGFQQRRRRFL